MQRPSYPKIKFNGNPLTVEEINKLSNGRVRATIRNRDNAIHNKKAEICSLREKIDDLGEVINMMVRAINNMA